MNPWRIGFLGTAELACPSLEALTGSDQFEVVGVVTQPDRPKGRDLKLEAPPVKACASRLNLPVFQPEKIRQPAAVDTVAAWHTDLIVVVAYGQILPAAVLQLPRWGCVNVHASLLPKYRGAAPIQWALLNDEPHTGVTIMKMDEGLDTGDILAQEAISIGPADDAQSLHDRLAALGARLLLPTLAGYIEGNILPRPQPLEPIAYARKIKKEDGRIDWAQPARALWNRVRAFTPWPGAFTSIPGASQAPLLKIWQTEVVPDMSGSPGQVLRADGTGLIVACGQQALRLVSVQREGKRRMDARSFLAGSELRPGQVLG